MKRLLKCFILPLLLILILGVIIWLALFAHFETAYRTASNREAAALIGSALELAPDLDAGEIVQILRDDSNVDVETVERGAAVLRQYGYFPEDYASSAAGALTAQFCLASLAFLVGLLVVLVGYFAILDYLRERRIQRLITYLQHLNQRIYDLHPDENSEDELSLLTNELYKITTTLKEAAEENRKHRQNLETALADISHQLRTPLTALQIMVDNIYDDPDMSPAVRQDFLRSISRQVETMSTLVTTLLHLAQFDNGSIQLQPTTLSVRELLSPVLENLAVLADLSDVKLELTGDLDAQVSLDARWQREALTNIIKNCIEHSPVGQKVHLLVDACPLFVRLQISDHGEGIKPADLKRIFERFYQIPGSTSDGIGIGLAFAKTIIEAEHGQIRVRSTPGQGAKFQVTYFS